MTLLSKKRSKTLPFHDPLTGLCLLHMRSWNTSGFHYWKMLKYPFSRDRITLICTAFYYFGTVSPVPTAQNHSHKLWSINGPTNGISPASIYWGILSRASRRSLAGTNAESRWAVNDLGCAQKPLLLPALQNLGDDVWTTATSPHSSQRSNTLCHAPSLFSWKLPYEPSYLTATRWQQGQQG